MKKYFIYSFLTIIFISLSSLSAAEFQVSLHDSYGDGWTGANLTVSVNNEIQLDSVTLETGNGPEFFAFNVENGDNVEITYVAGDYANETSYMVYNNIGIEIHHSGEGFYVPEDYSFVAEVVDADYGELSGIVTDAEGNPLPDTEIQISNENINNPPIYTENDGSYSTTLISSMGTYNVMFFKNGYFPQSINDVEIITDQTTELNVSLEILDGGDSLEDAFLITENQFSNENSTSAYSDYYEMGTDPLNYNQSANDVVYSFTLDEYKNISISLEGSSYDTQLAVYSANNYPTINNHIHYNDDYDFNRNKPLTKEGRTIEDKKRDRNMQSAIMDRNYGPGTYYIIVDGIGGQDGFFNINVTTEDYTTAEITEDFEFGYIPSNWTTHNANNDNAEWHVDTPFDFTSYSGEYAVSATAYDAPGQMDDWLITPKLLPTSENPNLSFMYQNSTDWSTEIFSLWISTTGTDIEDFEILVEEIIMEGGGTWQEYSLDLTEYLDQEIYFAVQCTSTPGNFQMDLDAFSLPLSNTEKDLAIIDHEMNFACVAEEENTFKATVRNFGSFLDNYELKLFDTDDNELASASFNNIPNNELAFCELNWIPEMEGEYSVYLKVVAENDIVEDNNYTNFADILAYPQGCQTVKIGEEKSEPYNEFYTPIISYASSSITETIYKAVNLPENGLVKAIGYDQMFIEDVNNIPVVIRMGETDQNSVENNVILGDELSVVFEGTLNFDTGFKTKMINLDNTYNYNGGNLVVMVEKQFSDTYSHESGFYMSEDYNMDAVTAAVGSIDVPVNPNNPDEDYIFHSKYPNTTLVFSQGASGEISGTVSDTNGEILQDVNITISNEEYNIIVTSNENGIFENNYVPTGEYNLEAELFGYNTYYAENIVINENEETIHNITMEPVNTVSVVGSLFGSDNPEIGIENANVKLTGYEDYETISLNDGTFQFEEIYINNEYEIEILANRYETYTATINVEEDNINLGDIILQELFLPATSVEASLDENQENATISWSSADSGIEKDFRYDDGTVINGLGFSSANENSIFGSIIIADVQINELNWFLRDWEQHSEVKFVFLGLDENNRPNSNDVIYETEMIPNTDEQWNSYSLENPMIIEGGFFYGILTPGISTYIGMDDGITAPYEFQENTHFFNQNLNNAETWTSNDEAEYFQNYLLRINGLDLSYENPSKQKYLKNSLINKRLVQSYNIYRFTEEDISNPENWTEIASEISENQYLDEEFSSLNSGIYYYAVQANFENGSSAYSISNKLLKDMQASLSINVKSPNSEPIENAEVNIFNDEESFNLITNNQGNIEIDEILLGSYTLEIMAEGFNFYSENIDVFYSNEIEITLSDLLLKPMNINAEEVDNTSNVDINWEAPSTEISDFRYDDGEVASGISSQQTTVLLGTIYNHNATLTGLSCMTVPSVQHDFVEFVILGLDENGMPDINQILYESGSLDNIDLQWTTHYLSEAIDTPDGFFVGISTIDTPFGLAIDNGTGNPYPFVPNVNFANANWQNGENDWTNLDNNFPNNLMIRAHGIDYGTISKKSISPKFYCNNNNNSSKNNFLEATEDINLDSVSKLELRELNSFNIYRLEDGEQSNNPENWELVSESNSATNYTDESISENGNYVYAVNALYSDESTSGFAFSNSVEILISNNEVEAFKTSLGRNYPNPFNPKTNISFSLAKETKTKITIYNILGQKVKILVNETLNAGNHLVEWNGKNSDNKTTASGIYFYKLETENYSKIQKMIMLK